MDNDTGESSAKLDRLERYLASDPANRHLVTEAIDLAMRLGRLDAARKHADAAVLALPDDPFLAQRRGNVLLAQGELAEAAAVFERLRTRTDDPAVAYSLGYALFKMGAFEQARTTLEPSVSGGSAPVAMAVLLLRVLHHLGHIEEAIRMAEPYLDANASSSELLGVAALLYFDDEQFEHADRFSRASLAAGARRLEALVVQGSLAL